MIAKILLWVVIAGAVAFGGHAALKKDTPADTVVQEETTTTSESAGKKMAFSAFIKQGGSYTCTVQQSMSDVTSTGTVYVQGGNLRGDFSTIAEGKPMDTSIIIKDGYQYMWSSAMKGGMKMKVDAGATGSTEAAATGTYSWNAEQIGDYDCQPWLTKESHAVRFELPAGVVFTDLAAMMKAGASMGR